MRPPLLATLAGFIGALAVSGFLAPWSFADKATDLQSVILRFRSDKGDEERIEGRVLVEDQQGGVLVEDRAGVYWTVTADQILAREAGSADSRPFDADELSAALQEAAGEKCQIVKTPHYVIATRASRAYAEWCGTLFERLRTAFLGYWEKADLPLTPDDRPLPVLILQTREQFADYAQQDGAAVIIGSAGYYSARTNRVVLFDLTSEQANGRTLGEAATREEITKRLAGAQGSIATVVHEAVHQLAFNSGLQTRYADNPMWISEGLAMYFETPDLRSSSGWRGIGKINAWRLGKFHDSRKERPENALAALIQNEDRFRDPESATDAYAESWALTHFLCTSRRKELVVYLKQLGQRPRLVFDSDKERLAAFEQAFGDLAEIERDMLRQMTRLKPSSR